MTLGDHMKKRRIELGQLQRDAARDLGVSQSTLIAWETNRATPSVCFLPRIIAFLGYDPYPEPQTLGERIVAKRRRLGLPRKHVAEHLGVDEGALAIWERAVRKPSERCLRIVTQFLSFEV